MALCFCFFLIGTSMCVSYFSSLQKEAITKEIRVYYIYFARWSSEPGRREQLLHFGN